MFRLNISCFFDDPVVDAPMRYRCEPASYCYLAATEWWSTGTNRVREKDTFLAPLKREKSSIYDVVVSKDCSTSTVSPHYPETIGPTFGFIMPMKASLGYPMTRKARSRWQTGRMHWWLDWCSLCDLPCWAEPCAECGMGITKWLCWLS